MPLLPTLGPHGKLAGCGLGIPGAWLPLQHRVRDVSHHAKAIGMQLNEKKTNLLIINKRTSRQAVPFVALTDGNPLPIVKQMRLLGIIVDADLTWWPLVDDVVARSKAKVWSLAKLREAGASSDQMKALYIARVRATIDYGCQVYGVLINGVQSSEIESIQSRCLQIILGPVTDKIFWSLKWRLEKREELC